MQPPTVTKIDDAQMTVYPKLKKTWLQIGCQGQEVVELQKLLANWGGYLHRCDGVFDAALEEAVKAFQRRVFLEATGQVNGLTWQALYTGAPVNMPILRRGDTGKTVVALQQALLTNGCYTAEIDGEFGLLTDAAVRIFQKRQGLVVDGVVGCCTWHALSKTPVR